jgi:signal transduction histidine kinase
MDEPRHLLHGSAPAASIERRLARAERILTCFQKSLGHDLPNQLVALQGVLQVLELEEGSRLSAEGRDYLKRLGDISRRLRETITTLRAIGRAAAETGPAEEVSLTELAREAAAEVKQLLPGRAITYHLRFQGTAVKTYRRPLQRAVVELVRALTQDAAEPVHVHLGSRPSSGGVELSVSVGEPGRASRERKLPEDVPPGAYAPGSPDSLTLALVRELADTWSGELLAEDGSEGSPRFLLLVRPPQ